MMIEGTTTSGQIQERAALSLEVKTAPRQDRGRVYYYVGKARDEEHAQIAKAALKYKFGGARVWKEGGYFLVYVRAAEDSSAPIKAAAETTTTGAAAEPAEAKPAPEPEKAPTVTDLEGEAVKSEAHKVKRFLESQNFKARLSDIISLVTAIKAKHNIMIKGAAATGKSKFIQLIAEYYKKSFTLVPCTAHTETDDIKGRYTAKANEKGDSLNITWEDSTTVKAIKRGDWVIFEEFNFLNPSVYSAFYELLDFRRQLTITEHEGETIKAHPETLFFCTMNEGYNGTNNLDSNSAISRRANNTVLIFDYLTPEEEARIISKKSGIKESEALKITKFIGHLRSEKESGGADYIDIGFDKCEQTAELIKNGIGSTSAAIEYSIINHIGKTKSERKALKEKMTLFITEEEPKSGGA